MSWDQQYRDGQGRYFPNEELVRFLGRTYGPMLQEKGSGLTAIEIGSGVGGNVWALAKWGFFVYGFEMSSEAIKLGVEHAKQNCFEHSKDYRQYIAPAPIHLPAKCANLVIDVQTMQHLSEEDARKMYKEIYRVLAVGGILFEIHWIGGKAAESIFPAHPELCKFDDEYPLAYSVMECGLSINRYEVMSRTYGNQLAQWAVIEAKKQ